MSTPEDKLESAAASVSAKIAEVKSLWVRWEPYAIAVGSFVLGAFVGHHL